MSDELGGSVAISGDVVVVGALVGHFTGRESGLASGRQWTGHDALAGTIADTFVLLANLLIDLSRNVI